MKLILQNNLWLLFFLNACLVYGQTISPELLKAIPNPYNQTYNFISDPDRILNPESQKKLNKLLQSLEESHQIHIVITLLKSIDHQDAPLFAHKLFNYWEIGKAKKNGILIFIVEDDWNIEFELAPHLLAYLPKAYYYQTALQTLVPLLKKRKYEEGLTKVLLHIQTRLKLAKTITNNKQRLEQELAKEKQNILVLRIYLTISLVFGLVISLIVVTTLYSKQDFYDKYITIRPCCKFIFLVLFPMPYLIIYFFLKKLLKKLRDAPRHSIRSGNILYKVNEKNKNNFLEAAKITHEEIVSDNYDLWATEGGDEILILRYSRQFSKYNQCPKCGRKTHYLAYNRTVVSATHRFSGKGEKKYICKNCSYMKMTTYTIPPFKAESSKPRNERHPVSGGGAGINW